jgi:hypothetical protein
MEIVVINSGHLDYFATIGYILWELGNFVVLGYILSPLWYIVLRKIWQPCGGSVKRNKRRRLTAGALQRPV